MQAPADAEDGQAVGVGQVQQHRFAAVALWRHVGGSGCMAGVVAAGQQQALDAQLERPSLRVLQPVGQRHGHQPQRFQHMRPALVDAVPALPVGRDLVHAL